MVRHIGRPRLKVRSFGLPYLQRNGKTDGSKASTYNVASPSFIAELPLHDGSPTRVATRRAKRSLKIFAPNCEANSSRRLTSELTLNSQKRWPTYREITVRFIILHTDA